MRRSLRWAFHFAAAVSAALFVGVCVLWVRSQWRSDRLERDCGGLNSWVVGTRAGGCYVELNRANWGWHDPAGWSYSASDPAGAPYAVDASELPEWSCPGLAVGRTDYGMLVMGGLPPMTTRGRYVFVSFWALAAAAAAPPALALSRRRRRPRTRTGHCMKCGYDLRATPSRCPECGAVPTG